MAYSLQIVHEEVAPRSLKGEVREGLRDLVEWVGVTRRILFHVHAVVVILNVFSLNVRLKR